jgi:hypothetical protein
VIVGALALAAGTWKRMSDALGRQPETSADMLPISKAGAWEAFEATDTSGEPVCARPQPRQPRWRRNRGQVVGRTHLLRMCVTSMGTRATSNIDMPADEEDPDDALFTRCV